MQLSMLPFNIDLLLLKEEEVKYMKPIKVLDIFDGFSRNFHKDGLFSIDIFGKVGEEKRNRSYAYIDLHVPIIHPVVFKAIVDLKALYGDIISSKAYVTFDKTTGEYTQSTALKGQTGYSYFISNLKDLKPAERPSMQREFNINILEKYRTTMFFNKLIVLPAGLRDYEIDENGKPSEDEINSLYRKVMSVAGVIDSVKDVSNTEYLDSARYNLQLKVNEVFNYLKNIVEGKHGFILDKWCGRKVFNSTRNVITSTIHAAADLHAPNLISSNQTVVGLYQYLRAIAPLAIKYIRDGFLSEVFLGPNSPAVLVNKTTLKKEMVHVHPEHYDQWMTNEGLEKILAKYSQENIRHSNIVIEDHYIGLIYKGKDMTYRLMHDIDELPSSRSKKDVYPISLTELLYLSVYKDSKNIPALVTRYPISGYGSIYPCYSYLKSTSRSEIRYELSDTWEKTDIVANEFPIYEEGFFNSLSPHSNMLQRLGATKSYDRNYIAKQYLFKNQYIFNNFQS